eukprot:4078054-Lingulodinium_polyedra.AAC.1
MHHTLVRPRCLGLLDPAELYPPSIKLALQVGHLANGNQASLFREVFPILRERKHIGSPNFE